MSPSSTDDGADARRCSTSVGSLACAISDIGTQRPNNEDRYHLSEDGGLLVVADGMGGHDHGEVAAEIACRTLASAYRRRPEGVDDGAGFLLAAFREAQAEVQDGSRDSRQGREMGTTLVAALRERSGAITVCHVGDSRAYLLADGGVTALTTDHSVVASLIAEGRLSADEARQHPWRNRLLQAIGISEGFAPEVATVPPGHQGYLLLCTDGLWECVSEHEISRTAARTSSALELVTQLVDLALGEGAPDNVTVAVADLSQAPGREPDPAAARGAR